MSLFWVTIGFRQHGPWICELNLIHCPHTAFWNIMILFCYWNPWRFHRRETEYFDGQEESLLATMEILGVFISFVGTGCPEVDGFPMGFHCEWPFHLSGSHPRINLCNCRFYDKFIPIYLLFYCLAKLYHCCAVVWRVKLMSSSAGTIQCPACGLRKPSLRRSKVYHVF